MTARSSRVRGATPPSSRQAILDDANMRAAELLFDMSALQGSERSRFGYKRAAKAIVALPASVLLLVESGALADVSLIGPASTRILTEFASEGRSPTVEKAMDASPRRTAVLAQRALRERFLSQHAMEGALSLKLSSSIVSVSRFRGDLQMHSTWSDGAERIEVMAEACLALGHSCMGITDHSHGLPVAGGISMEAARRQGEEIDGLNERYAGRLRIYKGIEANIRADGSLDLTLEERQAFEYVVAAPHALLRRGEDQTGRMLAAVRTPGVAILGHPRGRVFNVRAGVRADWSKVFAAAAERGVAIELDGNWHRQDLDWEFAARALDAGCLFALDSDAHAVEELGFTRFSIAHARLAGIPVDRVINCWPADRLAEWMRDRGQDP